MDVVDNRSKGDAAPDSPTRNKEDIKNGCSGNLPCLFWETTEPLWVESRVF